jgi:hypothetical protein
MDIANAIIDAGKLSADVSRAEGLRDEMLSTLAKDLREEVTYILGLAKQPFSDVLELFKTNLGGDFKYLAKELLAQGVQSATGYKLSAMMIGQRAKIYGMMNIVDTEADVCFSIPENILKLKASRYFNKLLAPEDPSERDSFILTSNEKWGTSDFVARLQEHDGLNEADAKDVATIRANQIGVPDLRTAFTMVQKGEMKKEQWLNIAKWGLGFTAKNAEVLYNSLFYDFGAMELFRISDLTTVSEAWLDKKLLALCLKPEDKATVKAMILARTMKTEIGQAWSILQDNYAWGNQTKEQLTKFLTDNHIPQAEADAKLVIADALRSKVAFKLVRDAAIYYYRKGEGDEMDLYDRLIALAIDPIIANAITVNEAAKFGIVWELPA